MHVSMVDLVLEMFEPNFLPFDAKAGNLGSGVAQTKPWVFVDTCRIHDYTGEFNDKTIGKHFRGIFIVLVNNYNISTRKVHTNAA